jgi:hypothetical protein
MTSCATTKKIRSGTDRVIASPIQTCVSTSQIGRRQNQKVQHHQKPTAGSLSIYLLSILQLHHDHHIIVTVLYYSHGSRHDIGVSFYILSFSTSSDNNNVIG